MSLITLEDRLSDLEADREAISSILRSIQTELRALQDRAERGELGTPAEAGRVLSDVRYWLKAARETESEINLVRKQSAGIANDYAIDLDRARSEIDCRLARLRSCCKK